MMQWLERLLDFSNILNTSIAASWLILVVLGLRLLLRRAPKWVNVALWGIAAVRLLMPFSIESVFSLIPSAQVVSDQLMQAGPVAGADPAYLEIVTNPSFGAPVSVELDRSISSFQWELLDLNILWFVGMAAMTLYTVVSWLSLRRTLVTAVLLRDNIYQCETVRSPFVLGFFRPKIYLPYGMEEPHVIAHEMTHIRRRDHWWKPLGFGLLTVHWFNPLMWLAYILLCRDIELACDEKVIAELGSEQRADYSQALVACSCNRRMIAACPLAFGEVGVKGRIRSIMNYRKPGFWVVVIAVVVCVTVAVCFLTDPKEISTPEPILDALSAAEVQWAQVTLWGAESDHIVLSESRIIDLISILNDLEENDFVRSKVPEHDLSLMIHCGEEQDILLHWDGDYTEFIFHSEMAGDVDSDYCYVNSEALNLFLSQFDPLEERVGKAAFKWFDYTEDISLMSFKQVLNIRIDEFPDVTFRYDAYDLTAVDGDGEAHILFSGMPIWSVYFCDLNADGYPEICSETSFGSGMIDNRIIVYDYADGVPYLLEDRGFHDYHLRRSETDGRLYADQVAYNSADLVASCRLILKNGSLQLDSTSSHLGDDKIVIRARLLEIHDGYYLVEPLDGNWKPGGVQVPMENVLPSPEPEVGDILQIEYEGSVQDINHSVWISNVCRISVAEEAPIVKVPTDTDLEGLWAGVLLVPIDGNVYRYDLTEGNPKGVYVDELLYTFTEETHVESIVWEVYSLKEYPDKTAVLMLSGTNSAWLCEYSPPRRCSDTALNNAIAAGYAVTEDGIATHGQDVWNQFNELTQQGKEASITVAHYYTLDPLRCDAAYYAAFKQDYPCLYLDQLSYDGKQYILTKGEGETGTYEYLMKYETTIYSTMSSLGTGNEYNYVLTHDNRVTFDQLWQSLTSSWSAYHIDHYIIYSEQH